MPLAPLKLQIADNLLVAAAALPLGCSGVWVLPPVRLGCTLLALAAALLLAAAAALGGRLRSPFHTLFHSELVRVLPPRNLLVNLALHFQVADRCE